MDKPGSWLAARVRFRVKSRLNQKVPLPQRTESPRGENEFMSESSEHPCAFDEFKLYYESTERVTDRRLAANRWNYSISIGMLLAIAAIFSWATNNIEYFSLACLVIVVIASLAFVFCLFWLRQVEDWKALNNAKFGVLNNMARKLEFEGPDGGTRSAQSFRPFEREWTALEGSKSTSKVRIFRLGRIEALNASGAELFMPRAFMALFICIFAATLAMMLFGGRPLWPNIVPPAENSANPISTSDIFNGTR
jgi:hypothetical protein